MIRIIPSTQQGLSIIELLIALAISSLLILGVTQIFVDNKSNYFFQQAQSDNTENARYTLLVLEEELRRTGYRTTTSTDFNWDFKKADSGNCAFEAGEVIRYDDTNNRLCIRYKPHIPGLTACDGLARSGPSKTYENAAEVTDIIVDLTFTGNTLLCNDQPVFDNLVDMQLEFGIGRAGSRETDFYGTEVLQPNQRIQSVRYAALIRSRSSNVADSNQSPAFSYWHETYYETAGVSAPDRALYMVTENTVPLRNQTR
ncbi:MAG: PilW family protein [Pseudomonas sp.]